MINVKRMVTLPLTYWKRIEAIQEEAGGTLSDALFAVVDLGFQTLDEEEEESESESEEEEEFEEEEEEEED